MNEFNFGAAIEHLKAGKKMTRSGWNGKGMFVFLIPAGEVPPETGVLENYFGKDEAGNPKLVPFLAALYLKTVGDMVVPWMASQTDILANDWVEVA